MNRATFHYKSIRPSALGSKTTSQPKNSVSKRAFPRIFETGKQPARFEHRVLLENKEDHTVGFERRSSRLNWLLPPLVTCDDGPAVHWHVCLATSTNSCWLFLIRVAPTLIPLQAAPSQRNLDQMLAERVMFKTSKREGARTLDPRFGIPPTIRGRGWGGVPNSILLVFSIEGKWDQKWYSRGHLSLP